MAARAIIASLALLAITGAAFAQDAVILVDVSNRTIPGHDVRPFQPYHPVYPTRNTPIRQTPITEFQGIVQKLQSAKSDALLLYTDYASRAGNDLKTFLKNITGFAEDIIRNLDTEPTFDDQDECWVKFEYRIKKIEHDARKAAVFSADQHHKYILGHMVVARMHLNKSEDYLKRCDKATRACGLPCETTPRVRRWRRLALDEIHRVRDDLPFNRRSYRDLVSHARRKLNHLKKQAICKSKEAVQDYKSCINTRL